MRRHTRVAGVLVAFVVAVALRAGPLQFSPLPFNPDGIVHAGHAATARSTGSLPLGQIATDDYLFTSLLTTASAVTGDTPLYVGQPVIAVIGAVPVLVVAAAARRIAQGLGWQPTRSGFVAGLAATLLAVEGLYLHRSMAVDEQTAGLLFVPLVAVALARAHQTGHRSWLVALLALLVALPPTHNLDSVVAGVFLLVWVGVALTAGESMRAIASSAVLAGGYWLYLAGYNVLVERVTASPIIQSARLTDAADLFVAWLVVVAVLGSWTLRSQRRTQRAVVLSVFAAFFALLGVNAVTTVFPEMPATPPALLAMLLPLAVPTAVAGWGVPLASASTRVGRALLALAGAVVVLIGFSLTAGLTPPYLNTIYRSQTFLHAPWAVLVAVGAAGLIGRAQARTALRTVPWAPLVAIVLVVCAAASIPVAFAGLSLLPYTGVTTEAEFASSGFATAHAVDPWATDDHLARITRYYRPAPLAKVSPVVAWATGGPPPDCPMVSQRSWTTVGAQLYPLPPVQVSARRYARALVARSLVYDGGARDPISMTVPSHESRASGC